MHLKSDVSTILKQFIAMVQTQYSVQVKAFRSDNGGEFFNAQVSELFNSKGIIHQSSCPHTPQQNGVVERKHRHIMETARAIRFQGHIPIKFWGECVLAAVHIINRIPSTVLDNKSPFEMMFSKSPDLSYMRIIGCLCHATKLLRTDKFGPRAIRSVFMGYSTTQKGYKLYDLENKVLFISRDVVFTESIFPFQIHTNTDMQAIVSDDETQVSAPILNDQDDDHVCMQDDTDSTTRHNVDHTLEEPNMNPSSVV